MIAVGAAGMSNYSAAMEYLNNQPGDGGCLPVCKWQCQSPECQPVCNPVCSPPRCETFCGMDTSSCKMNCQEPQCSIVCPEN